MICSPEAVVMGFPAAGAIPWASTPDGANVSVASAIAMAEQNEIAAYRTCIRSPSLFDAGGCLAQGARPYHPVCCEYVQQPVLRSRASHAIQGLGLERFAMCRVGLSLPLLAPP